MIELYSFLFSLGLGIAARLLYLATTALARRTDVLPVTIALDILTVCAVGGAFTAYVVLSGAVIAPYMFAALGAGYYFTYLLTRKKQRSQEQL